MASSTADRLGHFTVGRHAVAGTERDEIADLQISDGNFLFKCRLRIADCRLEKVTVRNRTAGPQTSDF